MRRNVDVQTFHRDSTVELLIQQIEDAVTNHLENGNRSKAMNRLRVPPLLTTKDMSPTFVLGFLIGALLVIVIKIGISLSCKSLIVLRVIFLGNTDFYRNILP